jgi:hypothetical protein
MKSKQLSVRSSTTPQGSWGCGRLSSSPAGEGHPPRGYVPAGPAAGTHKIADHSVHRWGVVAEYWPMSWPWLWQWEVDQVDEVDQELSQVCSINNVDAAVSRIPMHPPYQVS